MTADIYALSGPGLPQASQSYVVVPAGASVSNLDPGVFKGLTLTPKGCHDLIPGIPILGMSATHVIQNITRNCFHVHRGSVNALSDEQ